jgi:hypothetical protein
VLLVEFVEAGLVGRGHGWDLMTSGSGRRAVFPPERRRRA